VRVQQLLHRGHMSAIVEVPFGFGRPECGSQKRERGRRLRTDENDNFFHVRPLAFADVISDFKRQLAELQRQPQCSTLDTRPAQVIDVKVS